MEERALRFVSLKSIQINLSFLLTVTDEVNHLPVKTIKMNSLNLSCQQQMNVKPHRESILTYHDDIKGHCGLPVSNFE